VREQRDWASCRLVVELQANRPARSYFAPKYEHNRQYAMEQLAGGRDSIPEEKEKSAEELTQ
jgi:hypothetical protein